MADKKRVACLFLGSPQEWQREPIERLRGSYDVRVRYALGWKDQLPALTDDLSDEDWKPDVILTADTPSTKVALGKGLKTNADGAPLAPIVTLIGSQKEFKEAIYKDGKLTGLFDDDKPPDVESISVSSSATPTGSGFQPVPDENAVRLRIINVAMDCRRGSPGPGLVGVLWNSNNPTSDREKEELDETFGDLKGELTNIHDLKFVKVPAPLTDQPAVLLQAVKDQLATCQGLIVVEDPAIINYTDLFLEYLRERNTSESSNPLVAIAETRPFVLKGGLMSYGWNREEAYWEAVNLIDKILGENLGVGKLPEPRKLRFRFYINRDTASIVLKDDWWKPDKGWADVGAPLAN